MKIIEQLEELVIRLEDLKKQQNLTRDFVTQQLDEINSKILPELDAELLRVNDKAYKTGNRAKKYKILWTELMICLLKLTHSYLPFSPNTR